MWDEIRNFKKCLIMMFAKQEKDVVFIETVMGLAQQRRHCLVECIPLPQAVAKQAPLYFKKVVIYTFYFLTKQFIKYTPLNLVFDSIKHLPESPTSLCIKNIKNWLLVV